MSRRAYLFQVSAGHQLAIGVGLLLFADVMAAMSLDTIGLVGKAACVAAALASAGLGLAAIVNGFRTLWAKAKIFFGRR